LLTQMTELLQETVRIAISTGPRGFARAVQAAQAVTSLLQEYAAKGESYSGWDC
jgi:aarF domain-containing kinase